MANDNFDNSGNGNAGHSPGKGATGGSENDPERTLITLDQLSQTIEVMTSVVNRLRRHLNDQIESNRLGDVAATPDVAAATLLPEDEKETPAAQESRPADLIIEISTEEDFVDRLASSKSDKVVH